MSRWWAGVGSVVTGVEALRALDARMFTPSGWFALDAENRRVPRAVVATLARGLELVGQGAVRSVVGRLAAGFVVVDVDVDDDQGNAVADRVAGWCERRGWWFAVRPSGGAEGRHHVFVHVGADVDELQDVVSELRVVWGLPAKALEVRTQVRPLSAPHRRTGVVTAPYGQVRDLVRSCPLPLAGPHVESKAGGGRSRSVSATRSPLVPRPRPRRRLPSEWERYLVTGDRPELGGGDHSRSTYEAVATASMVRAGWSLDEAWQSVLEAPDGAMSRARAHRGRWVAYVWNAAVLDNDEVAPASTSSQTEVAVSLARHRLDALAWSLPVRQRPALLLVGHALLDRIVRTGKRRIPCPERDLVLDTALASRKTIRGALRLLDGSVGVLHRDAHSTTEPMSSFEFEIDVDETGVWQMPPPSRHSPTPAPPTAPGTWGALPRGAHQVWRALLEHGPSSAEEAALNGFMVERRDSEVTVSQLRTTTAALAALAEAGLVSCDADGTWRAGAQLVRDPDVLRHRGVASRVYEELREAVSSERRAWRARETGSWHRQRAAVLRANRAREQRWWGTLSHAERSRRSAKWASRFAELVPEEQARVKTQLCQRRQRAGGVEAERHQEWLESLSPDEYVARVRVHTLRYEAMHPETQARSVGLWIQHRLRWNLPGPGSPEPTTPRQMPVAAERPPMQDLVLEGVS